MALSLSEVVIASGNLGKVVEFRQLLEPLGINVSSLKDYDIESVEETGLSFLENALLKARHVAKCTGKAVIADDSGISVDCLQQQPGIYSARYSEDVYGRESDFEEKRDSYNNKKLVQTIQKMGIEQPIARYHAVIVMLNFPDDPLPKVAHDVLEGYIQFTPKGKNGFGYDPHFYISEHDKTAAELSTTIKNMISHRGKAMKKLLALLSQSN